MIRAQAYVKDNRLLILGIADFENGPVPFSFSETLDERMPDGPIDFGAEQLHPSVQRALDSSNDSIQSTIEKGKMSMAAEALVIRARLGDQNAMAMLGAISQNAKAGSERAAQAFRLVKEYIRKHPIEKEHAAFEADVPKDNEKIVQLAKSHLSSDDSMRKAASIIIYAPSIHVDKATVLVANGATLTDGKLVSQACATLAPGPRRAFAAGYKYCLRPVSQNAEYRAGQIVGRAARIQRVRQPDSKVSILSPLAGWELGE